MAESLPTFDGDTMTTWQVIRKLASIVLSAILIISIFAGILLGWYLRTMHHTVNIKVMVGLTITAVAIVAWLMKDIEDDVERLLKSTLELG